MIHAETFQRLHFEMRREFLQGGLLSKHPVVQDVGEILVAKRALEQLTLATFVEYFFRLEVGQEFFYVVVGSLSGEKLTRGDVEEGHAARSLSKVHSGQEVIFLVVQHVVAHRHAWRDEFRDAALDEFLCQLRVFQLVADGHTPPCADEFRQVGVEGVMGESRHLVLTLRPSPVVAMRQRDAQDAAGIDGIVAVGLVEVATAEEQQRVGMFLLQREELLHHGGEGLFFRSHLM